MPPHHAPELRGIVHTDEYEISLSRELGVCNGIITKYQKLLLRMERRHSMTTEVFLERCRQNEIPASGGCMEWLEANEELQRWTATRAEYEQLLNLMKVSNS